MRAKSSSILLIIFWALAHVISFYWIVTDELRVYCRGNCYVVSELARQLIGEFILAVFLGFLLPMLGDLGLGLLADSWRKFFLVLVLAVLAFQIELLIVDWIGGRLSDPFWLKENANRFARDILLRFAWPSVAVIVGALVGSVKRKYLFGARIRHA